MDPDLIDLFDGIERMALGGVASCLFELQGPQQLQSVTTEAVDPLLQPRCGGPDLNDLSSICAMFSINSGPIMWSPLVPARDENLFVMPHAVGHRHRPIVGVQFATAVANVLSDFSVEALHSDG